MENLEKELQKPVLWLVLRKKWFDMILFGEKREEYREMKRHWDRVFLSGGHIKVNRRIYHPTDVNIGFANGYSRKRRKFIITCRGLRTAYGEKEWGAYPGKQYHTLYLGSIVWSNC